MLLNHTFITRDSLNLVNAYAANGYFDTKISYKIDTLENWFDGKKANVVFEVNEGKPFYIRRIYTEFERKSLVDLYKFSYEDSKIKPNTRFTYSSLGTERNRITQLLRNAGYFAMSPNLVTMRVDTFLKEHELKDNAVLIDSVNARGGPKWLDIVVEMEKSPKKYTVDKIVIDLKSNEQSQTGFPIDLYGPTLSADRRASLNITKKQLVDSCEVHFKVSPSLVNRLNFNFLAERVYFEVGKIYMQQDARRTQSRLQELSMFQYVIVNYEVNDSLGKLTVYIETRMAQQFQLRAGMEAYTNDIAASAILPIGGASLSFRNKNTFSAVRTIDPERFWRCRAISRK